jgi:peptide/nickel transport system permease protein
VAEEYSLPLETLPAVTTEVDAGDVQIQRWLVLKRFARHRLALASLVVVVFFVLVAILANVLTPYNPYAQTFAPTLLPGPHHLLGTDELGRDELSRVILGARISLGVSSGAAAVAMLIGLVVGSLAGYFGRTVDNLLMRLVDVVLAFPALFLILIVAVTTGVTVITIILLIGGFSWMFLARLVRAEFLQIRELEYVQAARALGLSSRRIIWRHILPNAVGPIIVAGTFILAGALYVEAVLDFLGFGLSPEIPSWGNLLTSAQTSFYDVPMLAVAPGVLLTLTILSINFIGDGLRDAFDPRHSRNLR